ncbi:helix-turn-helix transcriptional regulator [Sedimentibacter sp. zth1]|uniref:helix-turn-helix domain-containing protein n=1 Tax=Sedimentibacter sp. zth1 TaxID=2816908 RepID=UPI001A91D44A|nr:helix-turn-helix transcriptional regulator [Sedimentibacter sp. zth1]QSX05446.1 helix-turn-helix transcriptional regulator [Sedimentibacter sp. zth1]
MKLLKIRQERIKKCWTLSYVAKQIGTTKQTVQYFETEKIKPSYEVLVKLENLFNLSHRDLFEQVPNENILSEK